MTNPMTNPIQQITPFYKILTILEIGAGITIPVCLFLNWQGLSFHSDNLMGNILSAGAILIAVFSNSIYYKFKK